MIARISLSKIREIARRDIPAPVDVVNLISTDAKRFPRYRWYGLLVAPPMAAVGGRVLWMGKVERHLVGERQADKLLVVRYPTHHRFMAMTLNPYYIAINRLREAGVQRFEASFTHATTAVRGLRHRRTLVAVHVTPRAAVDALAHVADALTPVAGELVYATRTTGEYDVLQPPAPTDPNPLTHPVVALFAPEGEVDDAAVAARAATLRDVCEDVAVAVCGAESPRAFMPGGGR